MLLSSTILFLIFAFEFCFLNHSQYLCNHHSHEHEELLEQQAAARKKQKPSSDQKQTTIKESFGHMVGYGSTLIVVYMFTILTTVHYRRSTSP